MSETVPDASLTAAKLADGAVTSAKIAAGAVTEAAFAPNAVLNNLEASGHTTVPAGAAMLSSSPNSAELIAAGYVSAGRLATTDTWANISGGTAASQSVAVWTGTEMLVWGDTTSGWRYNPTTNVWKAMSTTGQPETRYEPSAVWTGTEMIVWGGFNSTTFPSSGGRYNPTTDTWTIMSTTNAPAGRWGPSMVWTGTEMLLWGGGTSVMNNTGFRYNPAVGTGGTWTAFSNNGPLSARQGASAVWTGSEMLLWGGDNGKLLTYSDGIRFNPATNTWTWMAASNLWERCRHSAVWTGSRMLIWGGRNSGTTLMPNGGVYDPGSNTWSAISGTDAPTARADQSAVWTGSEMIVWGGYTTFSSTLEYASTGARYNPDTNIWTPTTMTGAPSARAKHRAVWTGTDMVIWGGTSGSRLSTGGKFHIGNTLYLYQRP
jgi:N-acetylneuraminic acid mutarotase